MLLFKNMNTEEYKKKLEEEKILLESELETIGIKNPKDNDWEAVPPPVEDGEDTDENDKADRFEDYEERSATLGTLETRLQDVILALGKIGTDKYGICEVSGEPIEPERLKANPAARTCSKHMNS
jgi:RNA polymerase-binding transcription factor DksA